jgi:hypothetical protein
MNKTQDQYDELEYSNDKDIEFVQDSRSGAYMISIGQKVTIDQFDLFVKEFRGQLA